MPECLFKNERLQNTFSCLLNKLMYFRAVKILFSGWYLLLIPLLFDVVSFVGVIIYALAGQQSLGYFLMGVLSFILNAVSWSFLAFFAHKVILTQLGGEWVHEETSIRNFLRPYLLLSASIALPEFILKQLSFNRWFSEFSKLEVIYMVMGTVALTTAIALIVLSTMGALMPASVVGQRDGFYLFRTQGIHNILRTAWQLVRWPGSVNIVWIITYISALIYTGENQRSNIIEAVINRDKILFAFVEHLQIGFVVTLIAMVLSLRYVELRGHRS